MGQKSQNKNEQFINKPFSTRHMTNPPPIYEINFSGDPDLLARVLVLLRSGSAQEVLRRCNKHFVFGLPDLVSQPVLPDYLRGSTDQYFVNVRHGVRTITEHKNRGRAEGVEVPAHTVTNGATFQRDVVYRIRDLVGFRSAY